MGDVVKIAGSNAGARRDHNEMLRLRADGMPARPPSPRVDTARCPQSDPNALRRWTAVAHYRTATRMVSHTHVFEEMGELHAIIEAGPDWATLDRIEIRYNFENAK